MNRALLVFGQLCKIKPSVECIKRHVFLSLSWRITKFPTMSASNLPKIIFVLGAPGKHGFKITQATPVINQIVIFWWLNLGAGKGTQCEKIVKTFGFTHLSAGDLLREERAREGSEFGALIEDYITNGKIVPVEITCSLLENAMTKTKKVTNLCLLTLTI